MAPEDARQISPLRLAYIGDTVWDLLVRSHLMLEGRNLHHMHLEATSRVNASAQAKALERMLSELTEEETDQIHRGRNAHAKHGAPRHQSQADYQAATGLETLIGYLYMTGRDERIRALFEIARGTFPETENRKA
ncbi:MAG: ribonuclease III [Clostridia bacterium]|nr:ribonuclease III [Clostridia bacterium]